MPTRAKITCNDDKELRMILDAIYETKTQLQLAKYSLLLAHHILEITAIPINEVIMQGFFLNEQWPSKAKISPSLISSDKSSMART